MSIIPYSHDEHYDLLASWFEDRGMARPEKQLFSDCGFLVNGNAIGFLFKTNSAQCYIDNVAVDPKASQPERDEALEILYRHLEETAVNDGFKVIFAQVERPTMQMRFHRLAYQPHKTFTLFYKSL